jgi:uncharacterized repeat protein (TIGR01451 family)
MSILRGRLALVLGGAGCVIAAGTARAETPACTTLPNTATASFALNGEPRTMASNMATVRVGELLDLNLSPSASTVELAPGAARDLSFALTNRGNGSEAFQLEGTIDAQGASLERYAIDRNQDGRFDSSDDLVVAPGGVTPVLAPGASVAILILVRAGTEPTNATLTLHARAATGSGTPGSNFAGRGDGGCDAVVGGTSAAGAATVRLTVDAGSDTSGISVFKSQSVTALNGSASAVRGSTVTYTIEPRFTGAGTVRNARIADLVPEGTAYLPGSILLDGAALSDAEDGDAGSFDGAAIHIALGDVTGPATRNIQFKVVIK